MHEFVKEATLFIASGVEACAALIIALAAIEAILKALPLLITRRMPTNDSSKVRLRLGKWLVLALEFLLAADIVKTAVAPDWNEIGQLAAIIIIRTILNYFLELDIERIAQRDATNS